RARTWRARVRLDLVVANLEVLVHGAVIRPRDHVRVALLDVTPAALRGAAQLRRRIRTPGQRAARVTQGRAGGDAVRALTVRAAVMIEGDVLLEQDDGVLDRAVGAVFRLRTDRRCRCQQHGGDTR